MARSIKLKINTDKYVTPKAEDIQDAKEFVLQREETGLLLQERIDNLLEEAAERVVIICYAYGVDPKRLLFSSAFNEDMMKEIGEVMNELEEEIMDLILEYSTRVTTDKDRINALLLWLSTLGRGDRNLQETLEGYMYKMMQDWNAAIAAMMYMGVKESDAVTKIKTYLHDIYQMPEVMTVIRSIRNEFAATYIYYGGVQKGAVGISNNGSTNVTNLAKRTLQMAWMRSQAMDFKEDGASGYYQLRGSTYNCDICDDEVGFHPNIDEILTKPYPHPGCCCYRVPIYDKHGYTRGKSDNIEKKGNSGESSSYNEIETDRGKVRIHSKHGKNEKEENEEIAKYLANKHNYNIDLLERKEGVKSADSYNHTLERRQEYKVNHTPTKSSIDNLIRDARKQADSIILRIDSNISPGDLRDAIVDRVNRSKNVTDITLIKEGKDVTYNRNQILDKSFKIQWEDFK